MKTSARGWPLSAVLLALCGAALVAMGLYFIFIRPPLLPEDLRYIGISSAQIEAASPGLAGWLTHVFRVMGGYIVATGILTATIAGTAFRVGQRGAGVGATLAGLASIGWMVVVNFMIDSEYKWLLLAIAALWAASLVLFWLEQRSRDIRPISID